MRRKFEEGDKEGSNLSRRNTLCNHDKAMENMDPNTPFDMGRVSPRNIRRRRGSRPWKLGDSEPNVHGARAEQGLFDVLISVDKGGSYWERMEEQVRGVGR